MKNLTSQSTTDTNRGVGGQGASLVDARLPQSLSMTSGAHQRAPAPRRGQEKVQSDSVYRHEIVNPRRSFKDLRTNIACSELGERRSGAKKQTWASGRLSGRVAAVPKADEESPPSHLMEQEESFLDVDPSVSWRDVWVPRMDAKSSNSTSGYGNDSVASTPTISENNSLLNNADNDNVEIVSNLFQGLGIAETPRPREAVSERKTWVSSQLSSGSDEDLFRTPRRRIVAAPMEQEASYLNEDPTVSWESIWEPREEA